MKMQANNLENKNFDVTLELADKETTLEIGLTEFCFGVSKIIMEMIDRNCETQIQASKFSEVILQLITANVSNYLADFDEIREQEIENHMYDLMEKMYIDWLDDIVCMTENEFLEVFKDSKELHLKPVACNNSIDIYVSNGKDEKFIINITTDTIENDNEMFENLCMVAYIIATVMGDKIFYDNSNPFRHENTNEKTLAEEIRRMI